METTIKSAILAAVTLGLAASASAQVAPWTQLTPTTNPTARERVATATDGNVLYMYGGQNSTTTSSYADFWSFDGTDWTKINAVGTACGARCSSSMAWDSARGKLVVFSGKGAAGVWADYATDTWEWDSVNGWVQAAPTTLPDGRWLTGGAAYVPGVGVVVHGGNAWSTTSSSGYTSNETWAWNGTDWTLLTNTGPAVQNGALVYRSANNDLIYFGGTLSGSTTAIPDTYRYDIGTNTWSQIVTATLPTSSAATGGPGLTGPTAYYHPITGKVVVHGGQGNGGSPSTLTWEFNGVDWTDVSAAGDANIRNSSAQYVAALGKALSSCGNSSNAAKNWTLEHDVPVVQVAYCTAGTSTNGCVPSIGASGSPSIAATSGFVIDVTGVEGQKQGLIFYGVSGRASATWGTGGTSFLCVKAPTQRTGTQSSGGTAGACDGVLSVDWLAFIAAHPAALGTPLTVGTIVDAQGWYRDPPAVKTTNLSNGLEFTLVP